MTELKGEIAPFSDQDLPVIIALWERAGLTRPWNNPGTDIAFAQQSPNTEILVCRAGNDIIATVMVGHDGHRGAVYYLAVDPDQQNRGLGKTMMAAAENWLKQQGVWKLNLMIRGDNNQVEAFYKQVGYLREDRIVMSRKLDEDPD